MRQEAGEREGVPTSSLRSALRGAGRVALWALVGLLLLRGFLDVTSSPPQSATPRRVAPSDEQASESFAVRFARAYLASPSTAALAPFLAESVRVGAGRPPLGGVSPVAQAEVSSSKELGDGTAILTVACELRDARTLYLAVPIVRSGAGEVAALGAPSIVAAPEVAGADSERPQPLLGADAASIQALIARFLPEYLAAAEASDLSYLLAPGAAIQPLGGAMELVSVSGVTQLGVGEGPSRSILAAVKVRDPETDATYPLVYRLDLTKHVRWYVERVEGALS